jgi:hypothetical protein
MKQGAVNMVDPADSKKILIQIKTRKSALTYISHISQRATRVRRRHRHLKADPVGLGPAAGTSGQGDAGRGGDDESLRRRPR